MLHNFTGRLREREATAWLGVVAAVLVLVAPYLVGGFQTSLLTRTMILIVFATAFNLLYGYTGLLSFGHAMFVATAGYAVAKVVQRVTPALGFNELFGGVSPLAKWAFAVFVGVLMATLLAVVIGYLSVRMEEIYFAIITLAFSMAIYSIYLQDTIGTVLAALDIGEKVFTNGSDGLTFVLGQVNLFGWKFELVNIVNPIAYYYLTFVCFVFGMYVLWRIVKSPFGMVCLAIRENPERARSVGIDVTYHQWITFIVSGAFSGFAGAVFVPLVTNVNPAYAHWTFSAQPVIMTVIGGPYSFLGPLMGALTYEYLRWFISQFPLLEEYWQFSFGVLLLLVVLFFNNGVAGGVDRFRAWLTVAQQHYAEDGISGVVAFTRETVTDYLRLARSHLVEGVKSLKRRITQRTSG